MSKRKTLLETMIADVDREIAVLQATKDRLLAQQAQHPKRTAKPVAEAPQ